jgi:hypothetical protein
MRGLKVGLKFCNLSGQPRVDGEALLRRIKGVYSTRAALSKTFAFTTDLSAVGFSPLPESASKNIELAAAPIRGTNVGTGSVRFLWNGGR